MSVVVRPLRDDEVRRFVEIHHAAVREIAIKDYAEDVINAWAPMPITDEAVASVRANPDDEIRLIAHIDGEPVGIGALVLGQSELRACYVVQRATRKGVGSSLVAEIERIARAHRLTYLRLDSSVTAEPFYRALGYEVEERGEHILRSGKRMASVNMRKVFR